MSEHRADAKNAGFHSAQVSGRNTIISRQLHMAVAVMSLIAAFCALGAIVLRPTASKPRWQSPIAYAASERASNAGGGRCLAPDAAVSENE